MRGFCKPKAARRPATRACFASRIQAQLGLAQLPIAIGIEGSQDLGGIVCPVIEIRRLQIHQAHRARPGSDHHKPNTRR